MAIPRRAWRFGALALVLAVGCAPSHRLVAESSRYFERCYGADFDDRVPDAEREACWEAWLAHYSRHQTAGRVDYALRRVEALQSLEPVPPLPGLGAAPGDIVAAPPTDVPEIASETRAAPAGCETACSGFEARCIAACPDRHVECRHGCIRERAICFAGCY